MSGAVAGWERHSSSGAGREAELNLPDRLDLPAGWEPERGELYAVNARFGTTDPEPAEYWVTLVRR